MSDVTVNRKYSIGITIDHHNGYHVDYRIFDMMVLPEYPHENVTRAMSGKGRNGADEFKEFIKRLKPHVITMSDEAYPLPASLIHEMLLIGYQWKEPEHGIDGYYLQAQAERGLND